MLRKPGAYRNPTDEQRRLSNIRKDDHARWFRSMWTDVPGASTKDAWPRTVVERRVSPARRREKH